MCEDEEGNAVDKSGPDDPATKSYLVPVDIDQPTADSTSDSSIYPFTLPFSEPLARERRYPRLWTVLPCQLANLACDGIKPHILLIWLNTIFETNFPFTPEADACLSEFIDDGCDLGMVCGYLRPWWHEIVPKGGFGALRSRMKSRIDEDYKLRAEAVVGSYITKSEIPPRRVWDLYANRVLPYHAMKPAIYEGKQYLPDNLWAVSHSWRPASERQSVLTTINGKAWHVPIPKGTTLNAIRDELLILGAEYVFLDVVCLRQKDELLPWMEGIRAREWRLDIPTIGHIYNAEASIEHLYQRPVVVYLNGLGLPLLNDPVDPRDKFHWFNRAWTLQETPDLPIFGGLKHKKGLLYFDNSYHSCAEGVSKTILGRLSKLRKTRQNLLASIEAIMSRQCSNPVDQVACLAYLLRCPRLPIYDADMGVEVAWSLLVECMPDKQRIQLLVIQFNGNRLTPCTSWRPTWQQAKAGGEIPSGFYWANLPLLHMDGSSPGSGYKYGFDAYYHKPFVVEGCYVHIPPSHSSGIDEFPHVRVPSVDGSSDETLSISFGNPPAPIRPDVPYLLICTGGSFVSSYWIVAQAVGSRRVDDVRGIEVCKLLPVEIKCALDIIKMASSLICSPFPAGDFHDLKKLVKMTARLVIWR